MHVNVQTQSTACINSLGSEGLHTNPNIHCNQAKHLSLYNIMLMVELTQSLDLHKEFLDNAIIYDVVNPFSSTFEL